MPHLAPGFQSRHRICINHDFLRSLLSAFLLCFPFSLFPFLLERSCSFLFSFRLSSFKMLLQWQMFFGESDFNITDNSCPATPSPDAWFCHRRRRLFPKPSPALASIDDKWPLKGVWGEHRSTTMLASVRCFHNHAISRANFNGIFCRHTPMTAPPACLCCHKCCSRQSFLLWQKDAHRHESIQYHLSTAANPFATEFCRSCRLQYSGNFLQYMVIQRCCILPYRLRLPSTGWYLPADFSKHPLSMPIFFSQSGGKTVYWCCLHPFPFPAAIIMAVQRKFFPMVILSAKQEAAEIFFLRLLLFLSPLLYHFCLESFCLRRSAITGL